MQTTITEYKNCPCTKCGGSGFMAVYQFNKGGECFRCGSTGNDPVMSEITREMTDDEVEAALAKAGFPIVWPERATTGDVFQDLFLSDSLMLYSYDDGIWLVAHNDECVMDKATKIVLVAKA